MAVSACKSVSAMGRRVNTLDRKQAKLGLAQGLIGWHKEAYAQLWA